MKFFVTRIRVVVDSTIVEADTEDMAERIVEHHKLRWSKKELTTRPYDAATLILEPLIEATVPPRGRRCGCVTK